MDSKRWQQVDTILQAALEMAADERDVFLDEACADDEALRKEVKSLLDSDEQGLSIIDEPAFDMVAGVLMNDTPRLSAGQYVGHYQIMDLLGTGGMGEVYLAYDSKLGRKVALKLLPADFTTDAERGRRFQQEARAASALNHPNIITIYEINQFDNRHFIATEYIEGQTLREFMKHSRLSLSEALEIAVQIAGALAAAHQAGIVHRDIKPENIMLRPDGYVKVLDFGLAKLIEHSSSPPTPTAEKHDTLPGIVLGTVKYMSPEQARGLKVDGRSDIFSFGVVLYEMITGSAPFEGETTSDLIALILKVEPPPLSAYLPDAPSEAERIISKALSKDKEERYQAISDMLADLKGLKQEIEHGLEIHRAIQTDGDNSAALATNRDRAAIQTADQPALSTGGSAAGRPALSIESIISNLKSHIAKAVIVLAMLFVAVAAIGYGIYRLIGTSKPSHFRNVTINRISTTGQVGGPAISPDGRYVAYLKNDGGQQNVWIRQLATASDTMIASNTSIREQLTFSPDGNYLYYVAQEENDSEPVLYQMPALGGVSQKLIMGVHSFVAVSPDGKRLAFKRDYSNNESAIIVVNADGTDERKVATRDLGEYFVSVAWSPDGKRLACVGGGGGGRNGAIPYGDVVEISAEGGDQKPITDHRWNDIHDAVWLSDGSGLIITAETQIWQVSYPGGEAHRITTDLNGYLGLSVSKDSSAIVSIQSVAIFTLYSQPAVYLADAAQLTSGSARMDGFSGISCTPDGKVVYSSAASGKPEIWIMDRDGKNQKQLTDGLGSNGRGLSVSPDGRYIVFVSRKSGGPEVWRIDIDGGNPKQLTYGAGGFNPFVSSDSKWVYYFTGAGQRVKVPIDGGEPVQLTGPFSHIVPRGLSPDGKLLAYILSDDPTRGHKLGIASAETGEPVKMKDLPPTAMPRSIEWTPDGKAITYIDNHKKVSNLWVQPLDGGPPKQLTNFKENNILFFAWSRDGKYLVFNRGFSTSDTVLINSAR